jgi:hypothetical protein
MEVLPTHSRYGWGRSGDMPDPGEDLSITHNFFSTEVVTDDDVEHNKLRISNKFTSFG